MSDEPFIAEIKMFGGNFSPRGWAFCDGQLLAISQNEALFSLIGTTYGGDGRTDFALPDLRGRVPMHAGDGPGLKNRSLGRKGGRETVTLSSKQMPTHSHTIESSGNGSSNTADLKVFNGLGDTSDPTKAKSITSKIPGGFDGISILSTKDEGDTIASAITNTSTGNLPKKTENTGGKLPIRNMQPYTAINFIIALSGMFPARN
jgi:microcystin-dependent protein